MAISLMNFKAKYGTSRMLPSKWLFGEKLG